MCGATWGDEGTTREQPTWTADPELIGRLEVGQACYVHRGAATTFVQVARPRPSPLTLTRSAGSADPPVRLPAPRRESAPARQPVADSRDNILGRLLITRSGQERTRDYRRLQHNDAGRATYGSAVDDLCIRRWITGLRCG
jgi:hypothetical protein